MARQGLWTASSTSKTLTETLASVATIPCGNMDRLHVSLETSNHSALDQFVIQIKPHASASFQNAYATSGDFTTPAGILIGTSSDLTALAENSSGWFILDVRALYQVNLQAAQAAGATTTLTIYVGGN